MRCYRPATAHLLVLSTAWLLAGCATHLPAAADPAEADPAEALDATARQDARLDQGAQLYARHCAACHGADGDGQGLAAPLLFPKPRDFQAGKFRLVSTAERLASRDDLRAALARGMPGSSMPPHAHLADEQLEALVEWLQQLRADGARVFYEQMLRDVELLTDEELLEDDVQAEIADYVARQLGAAEPLAVPHGLAASRAGPSAAPAVERGRQLFVRQECNKCHGEQGRGDGPEELVDDEGFAIRPRDLTRGIFKGGHDFDSLYHRLALGMPGTPMPSSAESLSTDEIADLVAYVLSLSDPATRERAVLTRQSLRASRLSRLPESVDAAAWRELPRHEVGLVPLWWRDAPAPRLELQAAHDGRTLALRLAWDDPTPDTRPLRTDQFRDMAAVQWAAGADEPFLGMGGAEGDVELWVWRAGARAAGEGEFLADDYPFESPVYFERLETPDATDWLTSRAAGNPLAAPSTGGGRLVAAGPGTTTFLPPESQQVVAEAAWSSGRWSVVFRRPLEVADGDGLSLTLGGRVSAAFSLWDGAAADRGGQKMVSFWNDLHLQ